MNILLNGAFWTQPNTGSGQYLHGLVRWLPQIAPHYHYVVLLPAAAGLGHPAPAGVTMLPLRTPFDTYNPNLAKLWFEQVSVPQIAALIQRSSKPALLHIPYFAPPLCSSLPVVTTVGDIIPLALPEYRGGLHVRAYMALARRAVRHSAHIVTFSAFSRDDIVAQLGLPFDCITPILLAADERYQPADCKQARAEVARRYDLHEPFIYYVGGLDARKNVETLIRAVAMLRRQGYSSLTLALAGRALGGDQRLFPDLDALIAACELGKVVRRIDVPYADGVLLYQAATIFAFPSRYEGFGLPPLEAMACGTPVVVSTASSLPEVVGSAALAVPPDDVAAWAEALKRLLEDVVLRDELRQRGLEQATRFSWRRVAMETLEVYERFLS